MSRRSSTASLNNLLRTFLCLTVPIMSASAGPAIASTLVSGIIHTDTDWSLSGSPYVMTANVQVATPATLTIGPGVVVIGNGWQIQVWGALIVRGACLQRSELRNLRVLGINGQASVIDISLALMNNADVSSWGGTATVRDSEIRGTGNFLDLDLPVGDSYVVRNRFIQALGVEARTGPANIHILNNVFDEATVRAILAQGSAGSSRIVVESNGFLGMSTRLVELAAGTIPPASLNASNNYWNTTDPNSIEAKIWDGNDDLFIENTVAFTPSLGEPDPNTPSVDDDLDPE